MSKITTVGLIGVTHPHSAAHMKTLNWMDEITDVPLFDADKSALSAFKVASGSPKITSLYTNLDALLEREDVPVVFVCLKNSETLMLLSVSQRRGNILSRRNLSHAMQKPLNLR